MSTVAGNSSLQVYVPFSIHGNIGGPNTFLNNLRDYFEATDFMYTTKYQDASCILFPISFDAKVLLHFRKRDRPVIQRLDGVYYREKHGYQKYFRNYRIKKSYNISTYKIFQSIFSRDCCFREFGVIPENEYSIIYNGADKKIFHPDDRLDCFDQKDGVWQFISYGNFRNIDMLRPIVRALDLLKNEVHFIYTIVGPLGNQEMLNYLLDRKYVRYIESLPKIAIAEKMKNSDIFLFCSLNPPCPNAVIESISSGVPVISFDDGAMPELLSFVMGLLVPCRGEGLYVRESELPVDLYAEYILKCIGDYGFYKRIFHDNSDSFTFTECGRKYVNVIKNLC